MSEEAEVQSAELSHAGVARQGSPPDARERGFVTGLAFALLVHSMLFVGFVRARPPQLGAPGGNPDAVSVELIDAADLASRETVPLPIETAAVPPGETPQPPRPETPPQPQQTPTPPAPEPTPPEPAKDLAKAAVTEPETAPPEPKPPAKRSAPEPARKQQKAKAESQPIDTASLDKEMTDLLSLRPDSKASQPPAAEPKAAKAPPAKPAPTKPKQPLDLSMPSSASPEAFGGNGAAVSRPPGITRSGENDDFARGVIRALRQTMPLPRGALGRVTVRITLSETGNLVEVKLLATSGDGSLDQNVMFAVKQSSFPLPPLRSKDVDRIFVVTYVYR